MASKEAVLADQKQVVGEWLAGAIKEDNKFRSRGSAAPGPSKRLPAQPRDLVLSRSVCAQGRAQDSSEPSGRSHRVPQNFIQQMKATQELDRTFSASVQHLTCHLDAAVSSPRVAFLMQLLVLLSIFFVDEQHVA